MQEKLEGYARFLKDRRLVPDFVIPYAVHWVRQYLELQTHYPGRDRAYLTSKFLNHLIQSEKWEHWQINQAAMAIKLYLTHYSHTSDNNVW